MSLSLIVAGGAILGGAASTRAANQATDVATQMQQYQSLINAEKAAFDAAAQQYNMTKQFGELLSGTQAMASAMGKQVTGGSIQAMEAEGRSTLQRDLGLLDKKADFARRAGELGAATAGFAGEKSKQSRNLGLLSRGLGLGSTMLA